MKLSDIKGARAFEVLPELGEKIKPLADDPEVVSLFSKRKVPKGMSANEFGMWWCGMALEIIVAKHKDVFVTVQSTIDGITPDEYIESATTKKMIDDVSGMYTDDAFIALFFSYAQRTGKPSGSALANTEESKA